VTDVVTGLIWMKNADCGQLRSNWAEQSRRVSLLASGQCGLSDNSSAGDWRLPTRAEFEATWDPSCPAPTLPNATGTGCAADGPNLFTLPPNNAAAFSTSTIDPTNMLNFIVMNFSNGTTFVYSRATTSPSPQVWAVRSTS
jgi:hypothetical protein